ncbi:MAG: hypothetical protein FWE30_04025 [Bacteroidales bacterium]|nr:hypothetical protein [Bacteroidales bacterium]
MPARATSTQGSDKVTMQKPFAKYIIVISLLLIYLNRGLLVCPYEMENQGEAEINSVIEWVSEWITGESNDMDEDGDSQTDLSLARTIQHDFLQQVTHLEYANLLSNNVEKNRFSYKENLLMQDFCFPIDYPPES